MEPFFSVGITVTGGYCVRFSHFPIAVECAALDLSGKNEQMQMTNCENVSGIVVSRHHLVVMHAISNPSTLSFHRL